MVVEKCYDDLVGWEKVNRQRNEREETEQQLENRAWDSDN